MTATYYPCATSSISSACPRSLSRNTVRISFASCSRSGYFTFSRLHFRSALISNSLTNPASNISMPAQAIIAALSVQRLTGGTTTNRFKPSDGKEALHDQSQKGIGSYTTTDDERLGHFQLFLLHIL